MYMVMFVIDDPSHLDEVLDAWDSIGVTGVTIIESTGINRRRRARQVGSMFMAGINRIMSSDQESHYTLFTMVHNQEIVQKCIAAAETIVGNLASPNSGVLASWQLDVVKGVPHTQTHSEA